MSTKISPARIETMTRAEPAGHDDAQVPSPHFWDKNDSLCAKLGRWFKSMESMKIRWPEAEKFARQFIEVQGVAAPELEAALISVQPALNESGAYGSDAIDTYTGALLTAAYRDAPLDIVHKLQVTPPHCLHSGLEFPRSLTVRSPVGSNPARRGNGSLVNESTIDVCAGEQDLTVINKGIVRRVGFMSGLLINSPKGTASNYLSCDISINYGALSYPHNDAKAAINPSCVVHWTDTPLTDYPEYALLYILKRSPTYYGANFSVEQLTRTVVPQTDSPLALYLDDLRALVEGKSEDLIKYLQALGQPPARVIRAKILDLARAHHA